MGSYTQIADEGARRAARRRWHDADRTLEAERTEAPFACPSCYDTSIVQLLCPSCEETMVRFDRSVVLPRESGRERSRAWAYLAAAALPVLVLLPFAISSGRSPVGHAIPGPLDDASAMAMFVVTAIAVLLALVGFAAHARRRGGARAERHARAFSLQPIAQLAGSARARVRGVARVRVDGDSSELFVEDPSGHVRIAVDDTLCAYRDGARAHAVSDGDRVEVYGELREELGEADTYRDRRRGAAFGRGATVLIRDALIRDVLIRDDG